MTTIKSFIRIVWKLLFCIAAFVPCNAIRRKERQKLSSTASQRYSTQRGSLRNLGTGSGEGMGKGKGKGKGKGQSSADIEDDSPQSPDESDNVFDHENRVSIDSEDGFLMFCQSQLLSPPVVADGLISQGDLEDFIADACNTMSDDYLPAFSCPTPQFFNLQMEVQLSFVYYICPTDEQINLPTCLSNLAMSGMDFGYPIAFNNAQAVAQNVLGFCCSLLPYLANANLTPMTDPSQCSTNLPNLVTTPDPTPPPVPPPSLPPVVPPVAQPVQAPTPVPAPVPPPMAAPTFRPVGPPSFPPVPNALPTPMPIGNGGQGTPTSLPPNASSNVPPNAAPDASQNAPSVGAPNVILITAPPTSADEGSPVSVVSATGGGGGDPGLSAGGTVGIVLGGASLFLIFGFLASRRRQKDEN